MQKHRWCRKLGKEMAELENFQLFSHRSTEFIWGNDERLGGEMKAEPRSRKALDKTKIVGPFFKDNRSICFLGAAVTTDHKLRGLTLWQLWEVGVCRATLPWRPQGRIPSLFIPVSDHWWQCLAVAVSISSSCLFLSYKDIHDGIWGPPG